MLNEFEGARKDLAEAQSLSPDDKSVQQKLALLAKREKQYEQKEKKVYAKMFGSSESKDTDSPGKVKAQQPSPTALPPASVASEVRSFAICVF